MAYELSVPTKHPTLIVATAIDVSFNPPKAWQHAIAFFKVHPHNKLQ
jgi:hypothetical protein